MTLKEASEHNLDNSRDRRIGGGCKQEDTDISRFVRDRRIGGGCTQEDTDISRFAVVSIFLYTKVTEGLSS